jgi:hypothetical protein
MLQPEVFDLGRLKVVEDELGLLNQDRLAILAVDELVGLRSLANLLRRNIVDLAGILARKIRAAGTGARIAAMPTGICTKNATLNRLRKSQHRLPPASGDCIWRSKSLIRAS